MMIISLLSFSCSPCKELSSIQTIESLEASCVFPQNRQKMWTCSSLPPINPSPLDLYDVHRDCKLDQWVDAEYFALNTGDSLRAAQVYFWLSKINHSEAKRLATLVLGERQLPKGLKVPILKVNKAPPIQSFEDITVLPSSINEPGLWGKYPYWHREEENSNRIVISPDSPVRVLRYALASRRDKQLPLEIIVLDSYLTWVTLHPPDSPNPEILRKDEEGWFPKTAREQLRLDISDEEPVIELLQLIAQNPQKTVEITMEHDPCMSSYANISCVSGSSTHPTVYFDSVEIDDYAACQAEGYCSAHKGTWQAAAEQCRFRGMFLPYATEASFFSKEQWTRSIGKKPHHRLTTAGRSLSKEEPLPSKIRCVTHHRPNHLQVSYKQQEIDEERHRRVHQLLQHEKSSSSLLKSESWRYLYTRYKAHHRARVFFSNSEGVYLGEADGLNFEHIAYSKPKWAIIIGENPLQLKRLMIVTTLITAVDTGEALIQLMQDEENLRKRLQEIEAKQNVTNLVEVWDKEGQDIRQAITKLYYNESDGHNWLQNSADFIFVQQMIHEERIVLLSGSWDGKKTIPSIHQALKELSYPIQTVYLGSVNPHSSQFDRTRWKKHILGLPMTDQTRVFMNQRNLLYIIDGKTFQERVAREEPIWLDAKEGHIPFVYLTGRLHEQSILEAQKASEE